MLPITSRSNPIVKQCRSLASSACERQQQELVFLEGRRLCCDAAACGAQLVQLLLTPQAQEQLCAAQLQQLCATAGEPVLLDPSIADYIAQTKSNQGVFALCRPPQWQQPCFTGGGQYLLLDTLQDPGNLGTILRCAEAFGIRCVLLSQGCADILSPKVLRSTMGSIFRQPVVQVQDLATTVQQMRAGGIAVYAAMLDNAAVTADSLPHSSSGTAVVVGNEGAGISAAVAQACSGSVYIPMLPGIESLNAATAASVLMWELCGRPRG